MMILTSATASAAAGTITTMTLVLIAIGMACAIAIIVWGAARRRAKAQEVAESEEHAALAGHAPATAIEPPATDVGVPLEPPVLAVAPTVVPDAAPTPIAPVIADVSAEPQRVTVLKGLGPKAATRLGELGIATVDQLAALSPAEADAIDAQMGSFTGRMVRDRWIEQARLLAAGDIKGFEAAFGKLGG